MPNTIFNFQDKQLGDISLETFNIDLHSPYLHNWVNQDHAGFWGMQGYSLDAVRKQQLKLREEGIEMFVGSHRGQPQFLLEIYRAQGTEIGQHISLTDSDYGMHILIAKTEHPQRGFTLSVFHCIMRFLFETMGAKRVVVEPDARNHKVHALNRKVGFIHSQKIYLENAGKEALLATCTAEQYYRSAAIHEQTLPEGIHHDGKAWLTVNRQLVSKALSEFIHERILKPTQQGENLYLLEGSNDIRYRFHAERLLMDHWLIDADSLEKFSSEQKGDILAVEFIQEFQTELGIDDAMLPTYLEEIASTLSSLLWKFQNPVANSRELVHADFQTLEQAMIEGHPCFVANSGRIGFDSEDFIRYTPESAQPVQLHWLAVHRDYAGFYAVDGISYETLINDELDLSLRLHFENQIRERGLKVEHYWLMPVHPWQWHNQLQRLFAGEIAEQRMIHLGAGDDAYTAQQSIRTFYNRSQPTKPYVKVALSILNMGFMRGLSSKYMSVTPAINQWVHETFAQDTFLQSQPFHILREYASMGYRHPQFDRGVMQTSAYNKMLAALWRDNPMTDISATQTPMTMAALLHVDKDGVALLPAIIKASGLSTELWLQRYFNLYLTPLLHCFYQHHMVFMPHGENLILILEDHIPVAAYIKDIGEEVCLLNSERELPDAVQRISVKIPPEMEILSIFADIFDCFFRFVSAILYQHSNFPSDYFWELVAECVHDYQASHPELQARFEQHDLFAESYPMSCLNRLQLRNNKQMVDLLNPADALQFAGQQDNPLAAFARERAEKKSAAG